MLVLPSEKHVAMGNPRSHPIEQLELGVQLSTPSSQSSHSSTCPSPHLPNHH